MHTLSLSLEEAFRDCLIDADPTAMLADTVRIVHHEDDGSQHGPIIVGPGAIIRDHVVLGTGVAVGARTLIGAQCVIRARVRIAEDCTVQHLVCIERDTTIGANSRVSALTHLTGGCIIADRVEIGARVVTVNDREMAWHGTPTLRAPVIEDDARIGSGSTLMAGVRIGAGAFVGAGSLVLKDVPAGMLAYGHPAYPQRPV